MARNRDRWRGGTAGSEAPWVAPAMLRDVAERLAAQDDTFPEGRTATGRAAGNVGLLTDGSEVTGDALRIGDQGQKLHAAVAGLTSKDVEIECALEKVGPRAIGPRLTA